MQSQNEKLLIQFEEFLQQGEQLSTQENDAITTKQTDLYQLFAELSALKAEVKKDARQQKEVLAQFTKLLATLESGNKQLSQELEQGKEHCQESITQSKKDLLMEIIDLNDRLQITVNSMHNFKPPLIERKVSREFRLSLQQGLEISLRRVKQLLSAHDVVVVESIGKTVNPHTMRVTEVCCEKDKEDGVVVEELQSGYLYQGKLLRLAEVIANKHDK